MAQKTTIRLVDDLDGSEADEQVSFALDGKMYEIDLSKANASKLRKILLPFVEKARKAGTTVRVASVRAPRGTVRGREERENAVAVREWGLANGFDVSPRGRIPRAVLEAYDNHLRGQAVTVAATVPAPVVEELAETHARTTEPKPEKSNVTELKFKAKAKPEPEPVTEEKPARTEYTDNDVMIWWLAGHINSKAKNVTSAMRAAYRKAHNIETPAKASNGA